MTDFTAEFKTDPSEIQYPVEITRPEGLRVWVVVDRVGAEICTCQGEAIAVYLAEMFNALKGRHG